MMEGRIIDLSMMIEEGMQTFAAPWHPFVEITQLGRHGIEDRETRKLVLGTHTGTHIDAPRHFIDGGETAENISLEQLVGPATVVDFSTAADFQELGVEDVIDATNGECPTRLIARFDWDRRLGTWQYYSDHAFFSEDACQWMVENGCRVLAMDTPQPDNPKNGRSSDNDAPNHKILLGAGVVLVEYLVNIKQIQSKEVFFVAAPLKIRHGDGSPARCFAIES